MSCNNEYLGKYVSLIHRQAAVFFTKEFNHFGFGAGQYMFMIHLYRNDGISQETLADIVNIDKGTTAKAIKKLEELGYLSRVRDKKDKRINRIFLTKKALEIKDDFFKVLTKWENILSSGLTNEELEIGLKLFNKISSNALNK